MENRSRRLRNLAQFKRPTLNQAELVDREFQRFQQPRSYPFADWDRIKRVAPS